jgi:hypothetical protein
MSRARSCHCPPGTSKPEHRATEGGDIIAMACNACLRFIWQRCRVCRRDYRDLQLHLAKSECGPFDKAGMWWTAERPPWAGSPPRTRRAT